MNPYTHPHPSAAHVMDRRIPSLDGARAISIALVIASHLLRNVPIPLLWRVEYGNLGVRIFFVISGFLITTLLLQERESSGRINIPQFYVRRLFRIAPAYYTFLGLIALAPAGWFLIDHPTRDFIASATYVSNYIFPNGTLGHTWSLSVEEQFYLIWPAALLLLGPRRAVVLCVALMVIAPICRLTGRDLAFECVSDALAVGCLLSILREGLWHRPWYRAAVQSPLVLLAPASGIVVMASGIHSYAMHSIGVSMLNIGIAMTLDRYMRITDTPIGEFLNLAPVRSVGKLSYSLYLWQQPFVFTRLAVPTIVKVLGPLACAVVSYYLVERPALRIRARISCESRYPCARISRPPTEATHA